MKHKQQNPIRSDFYPTAPSVHRLPEFIRFAQWSATPGQFREPQTQKELAEEIGVCEDTLTDWKKLPEFWPFVHQCLGEWIREKIPDAVGGLYLAASTKGSPKSVEMFLKLAGINQKKDKK